MLREAAAAVGEARASNVEVVHGDVTRLPQYPSRFFDAVLCATGLLYIPVTAALQEWHRLLKPRGRLAFSTIRAGSPPGGRIFRDCAAAFDVVLDDPCQELGSEDACRYALETAGFVVDEIVSETVEFSAHDLSVAWESNIRSPAHGEVRRLSKDDQDALKNRYLEALAREDRDRSGTLNHGDMLYALGHRVT
jgi:ubiquinone/menaquinone biosynthesis C-methylase UbiE